MPKNKKIEDGMESLELDFFDEISKEINTVFPNATKSLDDTKFVKRWIPTGSVMLDTIISNNSEYGGYPQGRIIEVMGLESTGKSLLGIEAIRSVQKMGGYSVYIDTEHSLDADWVEQLGLDKKRITYIDNLNTIEEIFSMIEIIVKKISEKNKKLKDKPILVIWDSIAATTTLQELEDEYAKPEMGYKARMMSKSIRKLHAQLSTYNVTFLCLNQLRQNIGPTAMFQKWVAPGGNTMRFYASVRIELARAKPILSSGTDDFVIGYNTVAKVVKNKVGPNKRTANFDIFFIKGIDDASAILDHLVANDVIKKHSAQKYSIEFNGETKEFKKSEWRSIFMSDEALHNYVIEQAKANLVIDLNNVDKNKLNVGGGSGKLVDYEMGVISVNRVQQTDDSEEDEEDDEK